MLGAYFRAVTLDNGQLINRVYVGSYANVTEAQAAAERIKDRHKIAGIVAKL